MCPLRVRFPARPGVPHLHRLVAAGGGEPLAVGAERHAVDSAGVPLEGEGFLPGRGVPHLHRLVTALAEASRLPSGLNATLLTEPVCPLRVRVSWPGLGVPHLHRPVIAGGGDPLAVGAERHARTALVCPLRVRVSCPVSASHTFTVWSPLAEAIRLPSGLNATLCDNRRCAP